MSGIGITNARLAELMSNPDPRNPYKFNGVDYAPRVISRVVNDAAAVVRVIDEAKGIRNLDNAQIAEGAGIDVGAVETMAATGEGSIDDFLAVTEALGVHPVTVPHAMVVR